MRHTAIHRFFALSLRHVRRAANRAAPGYDAAAVLQAEICDNLLERLDGIAVKPRTVLDAGCATGRSTLALAKRFRRARITGFDLSEQMLQTVVKNHTRSRRVTAVCGDAQILPFVDSSFDLVFSNLLLHWCNDIEGTLAEFRRVLKTDGRLVFSTLGPETLKELRQAWAAVDDFTHVNHFHDMHDIGDMAVRARLAEPVIDIDFFRMTYDEFDGLTRDLRQTGSQNATAGRRRSLTGKNRYKKLVRAYDSFREDGRLPATFEIVYGHARNPGAVDIGDGPEEVRVPLKGIGHRKNN